METPKLTDELRGFIDDLCDSLANEEIKSEQWAAHAKASPAYTRDLTHALAGEDGLTIEKRAIHRQKRQGMPAVQVTSRLVRVEIYLNRRKLEATVKRRAQAEVSSGFGLDVSTRAIGQIWRKRYGSRYDQS